MTDITSRRADNRPLTTGDRSRTPLLRWKLWQLVLLAFVAMCIQDVLATIMVVFESRQTLWVPGFFDFGSWIAGLVCAALAIDSIIQRGWRNSKSLAIIASVSAANYWGTTLGIYLSQIMSHHGGG